MGRGRGRGKRTMNRDFRGDRGNNWDNKRARWDEAPTTNKYFEEYYREQRICPPEEWDEFIAVCAKQLPLTFRINGGGRFANDLRRKLEADFLSDFASGPILIDGEVVNPPVALPWYPDKLGWQLEFSRSQLRKVPKLEALHEFMKRETEIGAITRQEAVSMVPPLFLDVQPHHRVLDTCAAPGSKTAQLLEALHVGVDEPTGVVVANDADTQRCNMLTHQTQRLRSPALLVCNHEAQNFPLLRDLDPSSSDVKVMYDRILCDVPCSGDGTVRKQPDIWRRWTPSNGNGLHMLQLRIALRGCELLRVGGRMVYSTCTFNPIEDEAVVAELLRRTNGAMELLDVSSELPELKRLPGMHTWKVKDRDGKWYTTWEEGKSGYKLDPSMFPGPDNESLPLQRCMRFLPHHQNTGGFFVAVLQKVKPIEGLQYPKMDHRAEQGKGKQQQGGEQGNGKPAGEAEGGDKPIAVEAAETEARGADADDEAEAGAAAPMEAAASAEEAPAAAGPQAPADPEAGAAEGEAAPEDGGAGSARVPPPKVLPEWGIRGGGSRNRGSEGGDGAADGGAQGRDKKQQGGGRWRGIDPIVPVTDASIVEGIRSFYGLGPECPILQGLISRNNDARPKKLTYINSGVKLLLQMDAREQIKVTAAGVKIFDRQDNREQILSCPYRIAQEGLHCLLPFITKQRFQPTLSELLAILKGRAVSLPEGFKMHITTKKGGEGGEAGAEEGEPPAPEVDGAEGAIDAGVAVEGDAPAAPAADGEAVDEADKGAKPARASLSDAETLEQLKNVEFGCCVATLRHADLAALGVAGAGDAAAMEAMFSVACWRGRGSLNVLVSRQECSQLADRLEEMMAGAKQ